YFIQGLFRDVLIPDRNLVQHHARHGPRHALKPWLVTAAGVAGLGTLGVLGHAYWHNHQTLLAVDQRLTAMSRADDGERLALLSRWAAERHGLPAEEIDLRLAAGDASFRRYYRLSLPGGVTRMLMDAPPEQEDSHPFVAIARRWAAAGLPVPRLHGEDLARGFLELDDLGDTPLQACFGHEDDAATL
ncbi:phosphotransferase, partial [Taklimakanibacter deserti]|uniref:phosphotransferase n=1 Tax=Taklimakanibacter deserti TaxID=2267839 RepID=UPI0034D5BBF4